MCRKMVLLTSFVLVLGMILTSVAKADLVGWWTFDEGFGTTTYDSSGNENHGTLGGVQWVPGKIDGALEFDGSSSIGVEIPFSESLKLLNQGDLTLTAWFKADEIPSGNKVVLQQADLNGTGRTWLYYRAGDDSIATYLGGGPTLSGVSIAAGTWYHAAVVVTEAGATDTITIYVNSEPAGTPGRMGMENCEGSYFVGRHKNVSNVWDGVIDDVRMFSGALTQRQIQQVAKGGSLTPAELASNPKPADEETDVPREVVLSWTPGEFAPPINGHKVYISENFNDVNDGIGGAAQDANSYDPGRLDFDTTYYWRVDEVNGPPDYTVYEGSVWSFTTEHFAYPIENITAAASSSAVAKGPENTVNGSGLDDSGLLHGKDGDDNMWLSDIAGPQPTWIEFQFDEVYKLHQMWVWNSNEFLEPVIGFGFKDVTIETSVDGTNCTALGTTAEFAQAPGTPDYAHNTTVDFGGVGAKHVRLTANSNWGGMLNQYGLSEVRFFYIPVWAREPSPDSGATDVDPDVVLSWRAGREAVTHDVYLSTDEQAVVDGTAAVTTVTETGYGPLPLDLGKTYYWQVDEVNEAETPAMWQGKLWNFTTQEYFVVDDFESYNDLDPTDPESNRIFNTWMDGYGDTTNGSIVGYEAPPFAEQTIVHGGKQSMPFFYGNTGGAAYSEAELPLSPPQNWTKAGAATFVLYFHGTEGNTGQLYVKVDGSKVLYPGDAGDIAKVEWNQWTIDLASLGAGVQNVTKLAIGIDGNGASGTLYVDDIRLYPLP